ncbi:5164_t:CDS:2 [Funneliformis caledonium]|uniref:5164_t:CDS:1 n=1 Tax=Funneliformis caledonium TaxID=1117310 RepID=A0A9N9CU50_9GLOM|nr:5164_t:CDS:2 [Funneliformis caledonium]
MPEAKLCHLPLGFNTLHKSNPFHYYAMTDCSISSSINTGLNVVLAYGHIYHKVCYDNTRFKCLYCLSFLQDDELLATKNIKNYLSKEPTEEHFHIIISLPETVSITPREQELLDQFAELQKSLVFIYEQVTLCNLKETIFAIYKTQEFEEKVLSFICNGKNITELLIIETNDAGYWINVDSTNPYCEPYLLISTSVIVN